MKRIVRVFCIALSALAACTIHAGSDPERIDAGLSALTNRILRLEHGDAADEAIPAWAKREGLSGEEVSAALVQAIESLGGSTNREDRIARNLAIGALGFHGTAAAVPTLEEIVRRESGAPFDAAMNALMILTKADAREVETVRRIVAEEREGDPAPLYGFYREMEHVLMWRDLGAEEATAVRTTLLKTAAESTAWRETADEILCAHVAGYAGSAARRANLAGAGAAARKLSATTAADGGTVPDPSVDFGPKYPATDDESPEEE